MEFILKNKTLTLVGKRASGKSELLRHLVEMTADNFYSIFLICPTEKVNGFYDGLINPSNIFDQYDEQWIEQLMDKMGKENANKSSNNSSHVLLILDDICADINLSKSKTIRQLFCRGRHLRISIIITAQYLFQIPPVLRCNSDFVAVGQMNAQSLDLLVGEFQYGNITKKEFKSMYLKSTNNYQFLLINCNTAKNNDDLSLIYGTIGINEGQLRIKN